MTMTSTSYEHEQWLAILRERFGESPAGWTFTCPSCGDQASGQDFREALAEHPRTRRDGTACTASDVLGQECIGRTIGALGLKEGEWTGRGCNWCAYGLFRGPDVITTAEGHQLYAFPIAPGAVSTP